MSALFWFSLFTVGLATSYKIEYTSNDINSVPQIVESRGRLLSKFSWSNCDSSTSASFSQLSLLPDPIIIPGDLTLQLQGQTPVDAISPLKADITLKRKILGFWVPLPCIDNFGTCDYDDFCTLLDTFFPPAQGCPPVFTQHNIPCNCPILTGSYNLPASVINIPSDPLPSFLTDGQYDLKLQIQTSSGTKLLCLDLQFTLG